MDTIKQRIDISLQRIANILLLNSNLIKNIGLLNGKMGIVIFFYHYSRYTGIKLYENYAGELIDEIYKVAGPTSSVDLANGVMGVGWGIEHLVKEKFVEADTDEILKEIDQFVFETIMRTPVLITNQNDLFDYGLYYLARLNRENEENILTLQKKHMLIHLLDNCEWLLTRDIVYDYKVPCFTLNQLNSILFFLLQIQQINLFPVKISKVCLYLQKYITEKVKMIQFKTELSTFRLIAYTFSQCITNSESFSTYHINRWMNEINVVAPDKDSIVHEIKRRAWDSLLYPIDFHKDINCISLVEKALDIVENEKKWDQQLDQLNKDNLSLNGLAGLGLFFLNEAANLITKVQTNH